MRSVPLKIRVTQLNKSSLVMIVAAVYGLTAVVMGAMGEHLITNDLGGERAKLLQLACFYQISHALLLIWIATQLQQSFWIKAAAFSFVFGILIFCGGLYILVFWGDTSVAWVTPVGGSLIILGWLNLVIYGFSKLKNP